MWPLELTATPETSPKYKSAGSLRRFGTESKGISCANAVPTIDKAASKKYFMEAQSINAGRPILAAAALSGGSSAAYQTLPSQQLLFQLNPPRVPGQFPVGPDNPMARHNQRNGIRRVSPPNRPRSRR